MTRRKASARGQTSDSLRAAIFIILSGGFQDSYTYICRGGVFANAQTGNIVLMSGNIFAGQWDAVIKYVIPVFMFLVGTAAAEFIHRKYKNRERVHWRQIILIIEILLLFAVGFIPAGLSHPANAIVSFVCALQVQTFHKVRGHIYASTMCIGNMRSGMEALCAYFHSRDKAALGRAGTYFAVILIFAVGAGLGSIAAGWMGIRTIWVCCPLLLVSFLMMLRN